MKAKIETLGTGESVHIDSPVDVVRANIQSITGRFRVIRESSTSCVVFRIGEFEKSLRQLTLEVIRDLGVFDVARIDGDIQYIRSIVSRYNNEHDRAMKINKINGVATLSENFMARPKITQKEYDEIVVDFDQKLELLRSRIIKDPDDL